MGLKTWYPLVENTNDYAGINHGTGITIDGYQSGKIGTAAQFNGTSSVVMLPPSAIPTGSKISIAFWAYKPVADSNSIILATTASDTVRILNIHLNFSTTLVFFDCGTDGTNYDRINKTGVAGDFTGWRHWVFTKDCVSGVMNIYLDGALWHTGSGMTKLIPNTITLAKIGYNYTGKINDMRLYNHVLSMKEIKELGKAKVMHLDFNSPVRPFSNPYINHQYGNYTIYNNFGVTASFNNLGESFEGSPIIRLNMDANIWFAY
jgi:hypothetical protein